MTTCKHGYRCGTWQECTTWESPSLRLREEPVLDLISIDNLPSTLPLEASGVWAA
jgi:saccharopine dehydrogenase (NAD+, L-lysine-forming)